MARVATVKITLQESTVMRCSTDHSLLLGRNDFLFGLLPS
jgi:hypothetical protein